MLPKRASILSDFDFTAVTPDARASRSTWELLKLVNMRMGNLGIKRLEFAGRLKTVHHWHGKIQNDQIRVKLQSLFDGFAAVLRLATDFPVTAPPQQGAQTAPDGGTIIGNKNTFQLSSISFSLRLSRGSTMAAIPLTLYAMHPYSLRRCARPHRIFLVFWEVLFANLRRWARPLNRPVRDERPRALAGRPNITDNLMGSEANSVTPEDSSSQRDATPLVSRSAVTRYAVAILATLFALSLRGLLTPFLGSKNPYHTVWAAIVFSAWYCGLGPSIVATLIGLVGVWYWLLPPFHSLSLADTSSPDVYGMIGFVLFSGLIIAMGESNRRTSSKRIVAENEGQRSKALFEAFMENSPAATYLKDEQGRYIYANRIATERFHVPSVLGKTDFDIFPSEMASEFREHDAMVLCDGKAREFIEHSLAGDGEHTWLTVKFLVRDTNGQKLLGGKSLDITDRHRAEEALREARQELAQRVRERTLELSRANEGLRELSVRLLQMQDEERRRIARELHDSVGQQLAAIGMNIALVKSEFDKLSPVASKAVLENEQMIQQINKEIRTISHLLHPPLLDEAGLRSALSWFVQQFGERSEIAVQLEITPSLGRLSPEVETAIFRVVQECLTNIHRHSGSSTALIRLNQDKGHLCLEVRDNGHGISAEKQIALASSVKGGVGMRGMRERVGQLGGALDIRSDEKGTIVTVTLPLPPSAAGADASEKVA